MRKSPLDALCQDTIFAKVVQLSLSLDQSKAFLPEAVLRLRIVKVETPVLIAIGLVLGEFSRRVVFRCGEYALEAHEQIPLTFAFPAYIASIFIASLNREHRGPVLVSEIQLTRNHLRQILCFLNLLLRIAIRLKCTLCTC